MNTRIILQATLIAIAVELVVIALAIAAARAADFDYDSPPPPIVIQPEVPGIVTPRCHVERETEHDSVLGDDWTEREVCDEE